MVRTHRALAGRADVPGGLLLGPPTARVPVVRDPGADARPTIPAYILGLPTLVFGWPTQNVLLAQAPRGRADHLRGLHARRSSGSGRPHRGMARRARPGRWCRPWSSWRGPSSGATTSSSSRTRRSSSASASSRPSSTSSSSGYACCGSYPDRRIVALLPVLLDRARRLVVGRPPGVGRRCRSSSAAAAPRASASASSGSSSRCSSAAATSARSPRRTASTSDCAGRSGPRGAPGRDRVAQRRAPPADRTALGGHPRRAHAQRRAARIFEPGDVIEARYRILGTLGSAAWAPSTRSSGLQRRQAPGAQGGPRGARPRARAARARSAASRRACITPTSCPSSTPTSPRRDTPTSSWSSCRAARSRDCEGRP